MNLVSREYKNVKPQYGFMRHQIGYMESRPGHFPIYTTEGKCTGFRVDPNRPVMIYHLVGHGSTYHEAEEMAARLLGVQKVTATTDDLWLMES